MQTLTCKEFYVMLVEQLTELVDTHSVSDKNAVVFDIDGTLFKEGVYEPSSTDDLITPVTDFYTYCLNHNVSPFIVTARPNYPKNMEMTNNILKTINLEPKIAYFMKYGEDPNITKAIARHDIKKHGYRVLMSIGDNTCDMGEHGGVGVLLNKTTDTHISYNITDKIPFTCKYVDY